MTALVRARFHVETPAPADVIYHVDPERRVVLKARLRVRVGRPRDNPFGGPQYDALHEADLVLRQFAGRSVVLTVREVRP